MKKALFVLAHGSKTKETEDALKQIMIMLEKDKDQTFDLLGFGFLQFSKPDFAQGIGNLVNKGAKEIVIVPMFLFQGNHMKKDIPKALEELQKNHKEVQFILAKHIGVDLRIADIIYERAKEASQV